MRVCFKVNSLPAEMQLRIHVGGAEQELNHMMPEASFELDRGEYPVELQSSTIDPIPKILDWLIYFSTIVIQGVFHILIWNTESNWLRNVHPIFLKTTFTICVSRDMNVKLIYKDAIYDEITSHWTMPSVNIVPDIPVETTFCIKQNEISSAYTQYARKVGAIYAVLLLILSYLLYVAIANRIILAIWILPLIICGMGAAVFFLLHSQNRKQKKVKKDLENFSTIPARQEYRHPAELPQKNADPERHTIT